MKVFVYGTLMKGFGNYNYYLKDRIISLKKGETEGLLYHLPAGYPGMIEGKGTVKGQIVELLNNGDIEKLDGLEGFYGEGKNNLYDRIEKEVFTEDGETLYCQAYIYRDIEYARNYGIYIQDGNWKSFMERI